MNKITSFTSSTYHTAKKYVDEKISKNPKVEAQREEALSKKEVSTTHKSFTATLGEHSKAAYHTIKGQWDKAISTVDNRTKEYQHLDPNERARPIAIALKIQRTELNRLD